MRSYLKSQVKNLEFEESTDSESSDENLPDNVLANHTELSSDNSDFDLSKTNIFNCSECVDNASVKSEPLSEDEENLNKSQENLKKLQSKSKKAKIKQCTSNEYNKLVQLDRNNLSSNLMADAENFNSNEIISKKKKDKVIKELDKVFEKKKLLNNYKNVSTDDEQMANDHSKSKLKNNILLNRQESEDILEINEISHSSFNEPKSPIKNHSTKKPKSKTGQQIIEVNKDKSDMSKNLSLSEESCSSDSENSNPKYSFQFNRSYEINSENLTSIKQCKASWENANKKNSSQLNRSYEVKDTSPAKQSKIKRKSIDDKISISKDVNNIKSKRKSTLIDSPTNLNNVNVLKNVVNSTALDISNLADTTLPNISQIQASDETFKRSFHELAEQEEPESKIVNEYLKNNENFRKTEISNYVSLESDSDEEVYLVQCPKNINPELLIDQNIFDSSFQYDGTIYNLSTVNNSSQKAALFVPGTSTKIKTFSLVGNIVIQSDIKPASIKKMKVEIPEPVKFPDKLKVRHPLFGKHYKKKIIIQSHVVEELNRKNKKSKKYKRKDNEEYHETDVINHQAKKSKSTSNISETETPKKKKKKKKQENKWISNDDIEKNLFAS